MLGQRLEYSAYPRIFENGKRKDPAWLFEMTRLKLERPYDGYLRSVELVAETERSTHVSDVTFDFQKLLVARANHRLLIFQAAEEERFKEIWEQCTKEIEDSTACIIGDRVLFAFYSHVK